MKNLSQKRFMCLGLILGLVSGIFVVITAYIAVPTMPGKFEVLIQALFCAILGVVGSLAGLTIWFIYNTFVTKLFSKK